MIINTLQVVDHNMLYLPMNINQSLKALLMLKENPDVFHSRSSHDGEYRRCLNALSCSIGLVFCLQVVCFGEFSADLHTLTHVLLLRR